MYQCVQGFFKLSPLCKALLAATVLNIYRFLNYKYIDVFCIILSNHKLFIEPAVVLWITWSLPGNGKAGKYTISELVVHNRQSLACKFSGRWLSTFIIMLALHFSQQKPFIFFGFPQTTNRDDAWPTNTHNLIHIQNSGTSLWTWFATPTGGPVWIN